MQQHADLLNVAQVCCPNGMDWDQDKGIFYFIDTADSVVRSYPVDENGVPKRSTEGVLIGVKEVNVQASHILAQVLHTVGPDRPPVQAVCCPGVIRIQHQAVVIRHRDRLRLQRVFMMWFS